MLNHPCRLLDDFSAVLSRCPRHLQTPAAGPLIMHQVRLSSAGAICLLKDAWPVWLGRVGQELETGDGSGWVGTNESRHGLVVHLARPIS